MSPTGKPAVAFKPFFTFYEQSLLSSIRCSGLIIRLLVCLTPALFVSPAPYLSTSYRSLPTTNTVDRVSRWLNQRTALLRSRCQNLASLASRPASTSLLIHPFSQPHLQASPPTPLPTPTRSPAPSSCPGTTSRSTDPVRSHPTPSLSFPLTRLSSPANPH